MKNIHCVTNCMKLVWHISVVLITFILQNIKWEQIIFGKKIFLNSSLQNGHRYLKNFIVFMLFLVICHCTSKLGNSDSLYLSTSYKCTSGCFPNLALSSL